MCVRVYLRVYIEIYSYDMLAVALTSGVNREAKQGRNTEGAHV